MPPNRLALGALLLPWVLASAATSPAAAPEGKCGKPGGCKAHIASDHLLLQIQGEGGRQTSRSVRKQGANSTAHRSLPSCVEVLVMGDYGMRDHNQAKVAAGLARVAEKVDPASIHGIGDNIYPDGAEEDPLLIARWWRDVYLKYPSLQRPWYIVTGNHDWHTDARTERDFTHHPENKGGWWRMPNFWYKTSYQTTSGLTVDMFHIDTAVMRGSSKPMQVLGHAAKQEQIAWLVDELKSSKADWKVALGHHPVYSAGSHGITTEILDELDPLLRKYGVPIFVAGHDHSKHVMQHAGMNYVISGAGGANHRYRSNEYPPGSLKNFYGNHGFVGLSFCDASAATLTIYDSHGDQQEAMKLPNEPPDWEPTNPGHSEQVPCGGVMLKDVDRVCSSDGCKVLADQMSFKTCGEYCRDNGLDCVGGWEEMGESCIATVTLGCDQSYGATSDLLCECAPGDVEPEPTCQGVALPNVKKSCSKDGCKVLARTKGKTCEEYCAASGLSCQGAWEEDDDSCTEEKSLECDEFYSTSDLICECS